MPDLRGEERRKQLQKLSACARKPKKLSTKNKNLLRNLVSNLPLRIALVGPHLDYLALIRRNQMKTLSVDQSERFKVQKIKFLINSFFTFKN